MGGLKLPLSLRSFGKFDLGKAGARFRIGDVRVVTPPGVAIAGSLAAYGVPGQSLQGGASHLFTGAGAVAPGFVLPIRFGESVRVFRQAAVGLRATNNVDVDAAMIVQRMNGSSPVVRDMIYVDTAGRFSEKEPSLGVYFELRLSRSDIASPDIIVSHVDAYVVDVHGKSQWRWDVNVREFSPQANLRSALAGLSLNFPVNAVEKALSVARQQLMQNAADAVSFSAPAATFAVPGYTPPRFSMLAPDTLLGRVIRMPLMLLLGAFPSPSFQSADKPWWTEGGEPMPREWDRNPPKGARRWYLDHTSRDGYRFTQLQEWNGSDWRPVKLKGIDIPAALQAKLDEWSKPQTPVVSGPKGGTSFSSPPARPGAPTPPAYSPSAPTIVSPDVIFANDTTLSKMPDGDHVIYLDRGGRIGTSGSPLTLRVGPDPDTGLRRWIVTSPVTGPLPVNFARSLEKLDGDAARVGQVVKLLEGRSDGVILTTHPNTGAWVQYKNWVTGWGVTGQYGYDLQRTQPDDTVPPRWGVRETYVYSSGYGWEKNWSGQNVPLALAKPLKIANEKLAREFEAKSQTPSKPAPVAEQTRVEPHQRLTPITYGELAANADTIIRLIDQSGTALIVDVYIDEVGRVVTKSPISGTFFAVSLNTPSSSLDISVEVVDAYVDGRWRWDATPISSDDHDLREAVSEPFPIDAVLTTLGVVRQRLAERGATTIAPAPTQTPVSAAQPLSDAEIEANATTLTHTFANNAQVCGYFDTVEVYVDAVGRIVGQRPLSSVFFHVWVNKDKLSNDGVYLSEVQAFSGQEPLWERYITGQNGRNVISALPPEFPLDAMTRTMDLAKQKMTATH